VLSEFELVTMMIKHNRPEFTCQHGGVVSSADTVGLRRGQSFYTHSISDSLPLLSISDVNKTKILKTKTKAKTKITRPPEINKCT